MNVYRQYLALLFVSLLMIVVPSMIVSADDLAKVRFAHFSPDFGAIDIYIDQSLLIEDVEFGMISDWFQIPSDLYTISIVSTNDDFENAMITGVLNTTHGDWLTIMLTGIFDRSSVALHTIVEDYSEILPGEARLTVAHAVEGLAPVNILLNERTLFQLVEYVNESGMGTTNGYVFADVVANLYDFRIVSNNNDSEELVNNPLEFSPGRNYFLAIIGIPSNVQWLIVSTPISEQQAYASVDFDRELDEGGTGYVRVAHLASGVPDMSFYLNGGLQYSGSIGFTRVSEFVEISTGVVSVLAEVAGVFEPISVDFQLDSQEYITIATIGFLDNDTLMLHVLRENFDALNTGEVRLSMFHAWQGQGALNLQLEDGTVLLSLLAYPGAQGDNDGLGTIDLSAGTYTLQVVNSDDDTIVIDLGDVTLSGENYFLLALTEANPPFVFDYVPLLPE